ncbi:hypothetical protein ACFQGT_00175 [Natrialbaceae archaeon GCM10025810]
MTDTVTVHVWQGDRLESYDDLLERDPDVYEVPVAETEFGRPHELTDNEQVQLAESIEHHGTYAFEIPNEERPATLNVHTNDSYHDPTEWGKPVERGLTFTEPDDREPYQCEMWGRIMMWVERTEDA